MVPSGWNYMKGAFHFLHEAFYFAVERREEWIYIKKHGQTLEPHTSCMSRSKKHDRTLQLRNEQVHGWHGCINDACWIRNSNFYHIFWLDLTTCFSTLHIFEQMRYSNGKFKSTHPLDKAALYFQNPWIPCSPDQYHLSALFTLRKLALVLNKAGKICM